MPRVRSLIETVAIDIAQRAHNCQGNANHRLEAGVKRLKVRKQRSWDHYCMECAKRILEQDVIKLQGLIQEFSST